MLQQRCPIAHGGNRSILARSLAAWRCAPISTRNVSAACAPTASQPRTQLRLEGECYEDIIDALAQRALSHSSATTSRVIIGVAGSPGSGKTTLAKAVVSRINELAEAEIAAQLPMDGFHYYRRELDAMPDPKEAHARRGAHWTFDAEKFVDCVRSVRDSCGVKAPSFDHGVGDPVPNDIWITRDHRIVVVEGNYVLLDLQPWHQLKEVFDDTWFVEVDLDVAMDRVFKRQTSIGLAPEVSRGRIAGNDRPNGELVNGSKQYAAVIVPSSVPFRSQAGKQKP